MCKPKYALVKCIDYILAPKSNKVMAEHCPVENGKSFRKIQKDDSFPSLNHSLEPKKKNLTPSIIWTRTILIGFVHLVPIIAAIEPFIILKPPFTDYIDYSVTILFKWHVPLGTLGLSFLTEAIWVFHSYLTIFPFLSHSGRYYMHLFFYFMAFFCFVGAWIVATYNHFLTGRPYYSSWHGLIAVLFTCYGILHYLGSLSLLYERIRSSFLLELYVLSLALIFTGQVLCMFTSLYSYWFTRTFFGFKWYLHFFILLIWYCFTIMNLLSSKTQIFSTQYKQNKHQQLPNKEINIINIS